MKTVLSIISFLIPLWASITIVDSDIIDNTVWDTDTVRLMTVVNVHKNATLTISPGTRIEGSKEFAWTRLHVYGKIIAVGTDDQPIIFDIEANDSQAQSWRGIRFNPNDSSINILDTSLFQFCTFKNTSSSLSGNYQYGGTIYCGLNYNVKFSNCTFQTGTAKYGGFIYSGDSSYLSIEKSSFINGTASGYNGGALFSDGTGAIVKIRDCNFENNICDSGSGGAISVVNANIVVAGCTFRNNTARYGGGLHIDRGEESVISRSLFTENKAHSLGGAILLYDGEYHVNNSIFTFNSSEDKAGAIYSGKSSPLFINLDFYGNTAKIGGGFYFTTLGGISSSPRVINSILHNRASESGDNIWSDLANTPSITYCNLINGVASLGTNAADGVMRCIYENNINEKPSVKDYAQEDFNRYSDSKCIDNGTPDTTGLILPSYDFYGNPRVANGKIDIGAVEYSGESSISFPDNTKPQSLLFAIVDGNSLQFSRKLNDPEIVSLYSTTGRLVSSFEITVGTSKIENINLSSGVYFWKIGTGRNIFKGIVTIH